EVKDGLDYTYSDICYVTNLISGRNATAIFTWIIPDYNRYTLSVHIDPEQEYDDIVQANNVRYVNFTISSQGYYYDHDEDTFFIEVCCFVGYTITAFIIMFFVWLLKRPSSKPSPDGLARYYPVPYSPPFTPYIPFDPYNPYRAYPVVQGSPSGKVPGTTAGQGYPTPYPIPYSKLPQYQLPPGSVILPPNAVFMPPPSQQKAIPNSPSSPSSPPAGAVSNVPHYQYPFSPYYSPYPFYSPYPVYPSQSQRPPVTFFLREQFPDGATVQWDSAGPASSNESIAAGGHKEDLSRPPQVNGQQLSEGETGKTEVEKEEKAGEVGKEKIEDRMVEKEKTEGGIVEKSAENMVDKVKGPPVSKDAGQESAKPAGAFRERQPEAEKTDLLKEPDNANKNEKEKGIKNESEEEKEKDNDIKRDNESEKKLPRCPACKINLVQQGDTSFCPACKKRYRTKKKNSPMSPPGSKG
ncbi:MAG: hypothetical protein QW728_04555, partial [Thermoplasmata archaeon]